MANVALRLPENVTGDFFVDSTCIDCDACRQIAPETFSEDDEYSIVHHQPRSAEEVKRALMALVACPTFADRFGCQRVMHADDGAARLAIEKALRGNRPMLLDDQLLAIPVPGHTRGHTVLLYRNQFLFTGDHLAWSPNRQTLTAFPEVCWYSWEAQTRSMEKLLDFRFEWVLPGHGWIHHDRPENMRTHLERCIDWMKMR